MSTKHQKQGAMLCVYVPVSLKERLELYQSQQEHTMPTTSQIVRESLMDWLSSRLPSKPENDTHA